MLLSHRQLWYAGAAAALGGLWWWYGGNPVTAVVTAGQQAAGWVLNVFDRGNVLSQSTLVQGVVLEDPQVLADMASAVIGDNVDLDTYSLARMGRSEGVDGMEYRMHVACNDLAALQAQYGTGVYSSLTALMVHSKVAAADGHYSQQSLGKRYATSKDPYEGDYALAQKVLADRANGIDPTGGASKFVDKSSFSSQPGATSTYAATVASWAQQGLQPVSPLPGASDDFVVFVKA